MQHLHKTSLHVLHVLHGYHSLDFHGADFMDELAFCRLDISTSPLISSPAYSIRREWCMQILHIPLHT